jgi:hypothetical protein
MTITQTVEIPDSHRLTIDVPREVPAGSTARFELKVIPLVRRDEKYTAAKQPQFKLSKNELDEIVQNAQTPVSDSLSGILAQLGDITIEQIREERLAKYIP